MVEVPKSKSDFVAKPMKVTVSPVQSKSYSLLTSDWVILTATYSAVILAILLIGNITPEGRLYIYFTAIWSTLLYFLTEDSNTDYYAKDIMDTMAEGLVPKKKSI